MESNTPSGEKHRLSVRVAGRFLTVVTEESEEDVRRIERELDSRIAELCRSSPRLATREGRVDAILLCAIDALDRELAAGRRLEEMRRELDRAERRYRALSGEYARLSADRTVPKKETPDAPRSADPRPREEKLARIRELLENERARAEEAKE